MLLRFLLSLSLITSVEAAAAQAVCGCKALDYDGRSVVNCDTQTLKGGYSLYYQYDCRTVWLTLQKGAWKKVIYKRNSELANLTYRLGYQPRGDFNQYTLFRYDCAANGPCNYVLLRKRGGRKVCSYDYRDLIGDPEQTKIPGILYFSDSRDSICIDYLAGTRKTIRFKVNASHFDPYSNYSWRDLSMKDKRLRMTYVRSDDNTGKLLTHRISVDLRPYLR